MFYICPSVLTNQKRGAAAVNAIMLRKEAKDFLKKRLTKRKNCPLLIEANPLLIRKRAITCTTKSPNSTTAFTSLSGSLYRLYPTFIILDYLCHFVHGILLLLGSVYSAEFFEHCCMFYSLNRVFDSLCFALILP